LIIFFIATDDIYAWINSDDVSLPDAFQGITKSLQKYPEISWIKGSTLSQDKNLKTINKLPCCIYNQEWIKKVSMSETLTLFTRKAYFGEKKLWKKIGEINGPLKLAGDYYLWTQFTKHSPL